MSNSESEKMIEAWLREKNIPFEREKELPNLMNHQGEALAVDFFLEFEFESRMIKGVIEYQGIQHFDNLHGNADDMMRQVRYGTNDDRRVMYARDTGIPLLVIHYRDRSQLSELLNRFTNEIKQWRGKKARRTLYTDNTIAYFGAMDGVVKPSLQDSPVEVEEIEARNYFKLKKETILINKEELKELYHELKDQKLVIRELNSQLAVARQEVQSLSFESTTTDLIERTDISELGLQFDRTGKVLLTEELKDIILPTMRLLTEFINKNLNKQQIDDVVNWFGYYNVTQDIVEDALRRVKKQIQLKNDRRLASFEYIRGVVKNILTEKNIKSNRHLADKARTVSTVFDEETGVFKIADIEVPQVRTINISKNPTQKTKRFTESFKKFVHEVSRTGYPLNKIEAAVRDVEKISHLTFLKFARGEF